MGTNGRRYKGSMRVIAAATAAAALLIGGFALARGPANSAPDFSTAYAPTAEPMAPTDEPIPTVKTPLEKHHAAATAICVRICDGYFFPSYSAVGGDATCASQCPDTPVAMYSMQSDSIDDAVSLSGERYTELPTANRYVTSMDSACTCHHQGYGSTYAALLKDPTLRKGDLVMTATGFVEYMGGSSEKAFIAVGRAPGIPADRRRDLQATKALLATE